MTRYFDHIQHRPAVRTSAAALAPAFALVPIDVDGAPTLERKAEAPREKKAKGPKALATPTSSGVATPASESGAATPAKPQKVKKQPSEAKDAESGASTPGGKAQKKEKKEKKPAEEGKKGGNGKAAADDAGEPVPSMVDLRVGHIVQGECASRTTPQ